ncbi:hypothetical protein SAMN05877838_2422 [Hoeflea halophila]|uniref:Hemerythrin-like domain-containing protein n=1 Tax=Hoeflea halophila TaxID=714899 RepID=A0A286IBS1_9HYPH|nr:hypothetical protein [Hoeflea halophila]SOE17522.1 hypothetical protein SAMN05877838_2422 [Hoeflea halophila]
MNAQSTIEPAAETKEDLYYAIHKGLRFANAKMLISLGSVEPSDEAAVTSVLQQFETHLMVSASHLHHENEKIHILLDERAPGATIHAGDDHAEHEQAFVEMRRMAADVAAAAHDRPAKLRSLYQRFAVYFADDLTHMNEEETVLMPLIEKHFSADEIVGIRTRIVQDIPPEEMALYSRAMLGAATPSERVAMVTGMHAGMPDNVFAAFMETVVGHPWRHGDWNALEASLC